MALASAGLGPYKEEKNNYGRHTILLSAQNISKSFGKKSVLQNLSFIVKKGEILGILGQEGSGKTVLLSIVVGLLNSLGTVFYLEEHTQRMLTIRTALNGIVGFSPQGTSFYPELTVRENLLHFGTLYYLGKKERQERADELLHYVDLQENANEPAGKLSYGMQRRLDIACSMVHNPDIIILDAPFSDLDNASREKICCLIRKIHADEKTIILTEHDAEHVAHICSRILMLKGGELIGE